MNENGNIAVYTWSALSNDGAYKDHGKYWLTQEKAYTEMMNAAVDKMKWNVEWNDVTEDCETFEKDGIVCSSETPDNGEKGNWGIGYKAEFHPQKIVHSSYSGWYAYNIERIEFSEEESRQIRAWEHWVQGEEIGISDITQAYTRTDGTRAAGLAWDKVVDEWELSVPQHDDLMEKFNADETGCIAVTWHLHLKPIADEINRRIVELTSAYEGESLVGTKIAVAFKDELFRFDLWGTGDLANFFECADDPHCIDDIVAVYIAKTDKEIGDMPSWFDVGWKRISRDEAIAIALKIENYINNKEEVK